MQCVLYSAVAIMVSRHSTVRRQREDAGPQFDLSDPSSSFGIRKKNKKKLEIGGFHPVINEEQFILMGALKVHFSLIQTINLLFYT